MPRASDPVRCSVAFDGYSSAPSVLGDLPQLITLVRTAASIAGMRILNLLTSDIKADLDKLEGESFADEGGYSVQALISTSHIALHTWPARRAFMFDLVSCRPFDAQQVVAFLKRQLQVEEIEHHYMVTDGYSDKRTARRAAEPDAVGPSTHSVG